MSIAKIAEFIDNDGTDDDESLANSLPNPQDGDLDDTDDDSDTDVDDVSDDTDDSIDDNVDDSNVDDQQDGDEQSQQQQTPNEQQQEEVVQPNIFLRRDGTASDKAGNIIDPVSGKIIARQGSERRLYESNVRLNARLSEVTEQSNKYKEIAENTNNMYITLANSGMTPDQIGGGIELLTSYHKDPVETTRKILAQTIAMGYNVSQIVGEGTGDAIEMSAIKHMLDSRLNQMQPQHQQTPVRQEDNDRRVITEFVNSHPGSQVHLKTIGEMVARSNELGQPITATEAYDRLREFCYKQGLDFNQPLPDRKPVQGQSNNRQQPRNQLPPRRSARTNTGQPIDKTGLANPNDSWDSIVRSAIKSR